MKIQLLKNSISETASKLDVFTSFLCLTSTGIEQEKAVTFDFSAVAIITFAR